jgi:hypothetical protein
MNIPNFLRFLGRKELVEDHQVSTPPRAAYADSEERKNEEICFFRIFS